MYLNQETIDTLLKSYETALRNEAAARRRFDDAWAEAMLAADGKNAEQRKAQADMATADLRSELRTAEITVEICRQTMNFYRAAMNEVQAA